MRLKRLHLIVMAAVTLCGYAVTQDNPFYRPLHVAGYHCGEMEELMGY